MPNNMMIDVFLGRIAGLKSEAGALGSINHAALKGTARELLLRQVLEPLMPPGLLALTGTIINTANIDREFRNQDDLVFYDPQRAPVLWSAPGCALMPIEGVVGHVEIKSTVTARDYEDAVQAAAEIVQMGHGKEAASGHLFAYASDMGGGGKSELERLLDATKKHWRPTPGQTACPIQAVCVLGRGFWGLVTEAKTGAQSWQHVRPESGREVLTFASIISNTLFRRTSPHGSGDASSASPGSPQRNVTGAGAYLLDIAWLEPCNP